MSNPILCAKDLCKTYVSEGVQFHAVRNVTPEVAPGGLTVIMGSSGHGKSTLLDLLSGLDTITVGRSGSTASAWTAGTSAPWPPFAAQAWDSCSRPSTWFPP